MFSFIVEEVPLPVNDCVGHLFYICGGRDFTDKEMAVCCCSSVVVR